MKGYVYIISNKSMPGILKIGYTMKDPAMRAEELSSTGVPYPYDVDYEILIDDPYILEQKVHQKLKHIRENKEWFRIDITQAVEAIHTCCSSKIYYERHIKKETEEKYKQHIMEKQNREKRIQKEEQKARIERENRKQEERKKIIEEEEKQKYIEDKTKINIIVFLFWGCFLAIVLGLISQNIFIVFFVIFCILIVMPIYKNFTREKNIFIWTDEFLRLKISQNKKTSSIHPDINIKETYPTIEEHDTKFSTIIIFCPSCQQKLRIPANKTIIVHCGNCGRRFRFPQSV